MATKNKKITYDINELFEEYTSSLGLSLSEKKELSNLNLKLQEKLSIKLTLEQDLIVIQSEVDNIDDKRSNEEILNEINEIQDIVDNNQTDDILNVFQSDSLEASLKMAYDRIATLDEILAKHDELRVTQDNIDNLSNEIDELLTRKAELETKQENSSVDNVENFTSFLKNKKLSTIHAEEIYNHYYNPTQNPLMLEDNNFKMRKSHPKRDAFIKKVLIPAMVTGAGVGAVIGAIAGSGLIGGSLVLGFIPVSGTPGLTAIATSMVGAVAGLVATPIVIKAKNALTRAYYKMAYKGAKKNLKEYKNGASLDSLYISRLIEKIQKTKQEILKMNQGNWLTRKFTFIPKHIKNAVNRNRIHHLEAYTKELVDMYNIIELNNVDNKNERLKPIYDLLKHVESFVSNDIAESKLNAMLTCKNSKKHSHASTIENVDIFATLRLYIDSMAEASIKNKASKVKEAKLSSKNLRHKKQVANSILKGDRLIAKMVARYENSLIEETVIPEMIEEVNVSEEDIAEEVVLMVEEITEEVLPEVVQVPEEQETGLVFIFDDEIPAEVEATETKDTETQNILDGGLVKKTTQRLKYSSTPITHSGETVGVKLAVDANGNKDKVEIRYLASKKKIRIKTNDGEKFVPVTDSIIPPINQMNEILKAVANDQHISNAESLTIL